MRRSALLLTLPLLFGLAACGGDDATNPEAAVEAAPPAVGDTAPYGEPLAPAAPPADGLYPDSTIPPAPEDAPAGGGLIDDNE